MARGVDLAALLGSPPRSVAWRKRRRFDPATARKEGVWSPSLENTNLTPEDREVFETGVGESTQICTFTGVPRCTGVDNAVEWLQAVRLTAPAHYRFHWAHGPPVQAQVADRIVCGARGRGSAV